MTLEKLSVLIVCWSAVLSLQVGVIGYLILSEMGRLAGKKEDAEK